MSIASEITRLQGVKSDILTAIADKGVTVPAGSALDDCPDLIGDIPTGSSYKVIGGREYRTVVMPDGKEWLAENLDFKFCNIGGSGIQGTPNAWYYNDDESTYGWNGYKCGLLYNWYAAKFLNDNRSELCPGWHVPTIDEWTSLGDAVGGTTTGGTKLKATDVSWAQSWGGTDDFGFSALPAGFYGYNDRFRSISEAALFWTTSEIDASRAYRAHLGTNPQMSLISSVKADGFSLRLVKD